MVTKKKSSLKGLLCTKGSCATVKKEKKKNIQQIDKPYTKSQIASYMSCGADISKVQATSALGSLSELIEMHLKKRGPGEFTLPGLVKFRIVRKPATKARKGKNPFTGEMMTYPARPARNVVKIRPLKNLKDIVA